MSLPKYLETKFTTRRNSPPRAPGLLEVAEEIGLVTRALRHCPDAKLPKIVRDLEKWSFAARYRGRRNPQFCSAFANGSDRKLGIVVLSNQKDEMEKTHVELMRNLRIEDDEVKFESLVFRISNLAFPKLLPRLNVQDQKLRTMCRQLEYRERAKKKEFNRRTFPPALRALIMQRDGFACVLCGIDAQQCKGRGTLLTVDHIIPWCEGGKTSYENGRVLCGICNSDKEVARRSLGFSQLG